MKRETKIHIKSLDNLIGKLIIRFYLISIVPLFFLTPVLLSYLNKPAPLFFAGQITGQYEDVAYLKGRKGKRIEKKCIALTMNDSLKFILLQSSINDILKNNLNIDDSVLIEYRILPRYRHELSGLIETLTFAKEKEDYIESRMPYFSIEQLATKDKILIEESKSFIRNAILIFAISLVWFLIGLGNRLKGIWISVPDKKHSGLGISKPIQHNHGKIIKKFSSCPACGMKLKDSDLECSDCGLNFN